MKPTKEQIEAALRWIDNLSKDFPSGHLIILAAAYRDAIKQRDTLAEALREYMACHKRHGYATKEKIDKAEAALATLKGDQP